MPAEATRLTNDAVPELLATKLHIPSPRPNAVPRPHLIARLNEGLARPITLLSAPVGFGKTTLLSTWLASLTPQPPLLKSHAARERSTVELKDDFRRGGVRIAWITLDAGDNDPARFLAYLFAALQIDRPPALRAPRLPNLEDILTPLINRLSASANPIVLVLDDYHLVEAVVVHQALSFLIDHQPAPLHVVIASRADPPLPLSRWRARDHLLELRQADLRFTLDEAAQFLTRVIDLPLSETDTAALTTRTEGWIAGLQLAAMSLQGQTPQQMSTFIQAFTGSDRFVLDYLGEEVLAHQPPDVQVFLLQTSVLDRMTGPLCDAVTERTNSAAVLEQLDRANLFIVPLDNERRWYRYHRLFADLLQRRLIQMRSAEVNDLHRRAGEWCEQHTLMTEAIHHALSAEDFDRAAELIEREAEPALMRSEAATLLTWIAALPDHAKQTRSALLFYEAWARLLSSRPLSEEELQQRVAIATTEQSVHIELLRAAMALMQGHLPEALHLVQQANLHLPENAPFLQTIATWLLSLSRLAAGDATGARTLEESIATAKQSGNISTAVLSLCSMGELRIRQGKLHEAEAVYQHALELALDDDGQPRPVACMPLMALGDIARERNEFETARRYLQQGIELARQWREVGAQRGLQALALLQQAQGDSIGATASMQEAVELARRSEVTEIDDLAVAVSAAQLAIRQGDLAAAERWADARGLTGQTQTIGVSVDADWVAQHLRKYELVALARLRLAQQRYAEALDLLDTWVPKFEELGRVQSVIIIEIYRALALQGLQRGEEALSALERALILAEPEGYVRIFLDEGEALRLLLQKMKDAGGRMKGYASRLLAAFEPSGTVQAVLHPSSLSPQPLVEPLSQRELEILRLIADGFTNQEIADRLVLSLPTVKWHTGNLYGKLGVNSRTQAVAKARELGILTP